MKVLNPINHIDINEYLLDSLEKCSNIDDFCRNCYRVLADYVEIENFILYRHKNNIVNLIYQHNLSSIQRIDYSLVIKSIAPENCSINQIYINEKDYCSFSHQDAYYNWLTQQNIHSLFISSLNYKKELLGNLFIEIKG